MNKAELITALSIDADITKETARRVLSRLEDILATNLGKKEETALGFLKIGTAEKAARTGRNPSTGEPMEIAARTVVKVSVSKSLKDAANNYNA